MNTYAFTQRTIIALFSLLLILGCSTGLMGQEEKDMALSREVEKVGERQFMVTVIIKKEKVEGYAKLEEKIPQGFVPSKEKTMQANWVGKDEKVKFIWMELPKENEFEVAYKLTQKKSKSGTYRIEGRLSCVSGEDLLRVEDSSSFEIEEPKELAQGEEGPSQSSKAKDQKEKAEQDPDEGDKLASKDGGVGTKEGSSEEAETDGGEKEESETPRDTEDEEPGWESDDEDRASSGSENAYFSVQVGAFGEPKNDRYFEKRYDISVQNLNSYQEGGLYKYALGRFGTYEAARKEKKKLRSEGLKGAFVVGFKGSEPVDASSLR